MSIETVDAALSPEGGLETVETQQQTNARVARATGVLALGNVTSRVLGLLREVVLTNLFGASSAAAAFKVAILVPKGIFDLLIGGHVNGAIIPVLSEVVAKNGRDELWRLVSILLSMITVVLAGLVLVVHFTAPWIVDLFGGGLDSYTKNLTIDLLRLTSPALIFMGIFAILSGTLYALHSFAWPAFATTVFNGTIVVIALVFAPPAQYVPVIVQHHVYFRLARPDHGVTIMAVGWVVGAIASMLLQLPGLRDARLRFTLVWKHPAIRQIVMLYIPVMFSLVMDTLIIRPFSYNLASRTGGSSIPYMDYATTLIQFPQGLVATAISIAILPTLARQSALMLNTGTPESQENSTAFKNTLGLGLRLATILILPAAVGLFVLAKPIVELLFEHGAFHPQDTAMTAQVLRFYLFGLPFAALDLLLVYAFYARQDTLTPAAVGLFSLVIYMAVAFALLDRYGLLSLMIADSVKHLVHASLSAYLLHRKLDGLGSQRLLVTAGKTGIAAAGMGVTAFLLLPPVYAWIGSTGIIREALIVAICGGIPTLVFVGLAYLLHIEEWRWFMNVILQRVGLRG